MSPILLLTHPSHVILPSDEAATRSVMCYLTRSGLPYRVDRIMNADSCSPDHLLPVTIVNGFIETGYTSLCLRLKTLKANKSLDFDMMRLSSRNLKHTYIFWISDLLRNIMLYFTWLHETTYNNFTYKRLEASTRCLLITQFIARRKRKQHTDFLKSINWDKRSIGDISKDMEALCVSVVELLGSGPFLFESDSPGKADALLYGYWTVFYEFSEYFNALKPIMDKYSTISDLVQRIAEQCNQPVIVFK